MARAKDFHLAVETIVYDKVVCHADTMGFHGMPLPIMVVTYFSVVEVRHSTGSHADG